MINVKFCLVKFSNGEEHCYKTSFDGLEKDEDIVVDLLIEGVPELWKAKFVKYIDEPTVPIKELRSVVGRWL